MAPKLIKFGDHFYTLRYQYYSSKREADKEAKLQRFLGHKARVIRQGDKWSLYIRR